MGFGWSGALFKSWVQDSVFSAGRGVSYVEAWITANLDIEDILADARRDDLHIFIADVIVSVDSRVGLGYWVGFARSIFHVMHRSGCGWSLSLGLPWSGIPKGRPLTMVVDCGTLYALESVCPRACVVSVLNCMLTTVCTRRTVLMVLECGKVH